MRVIPGMLEVADREREAMWEASAAMDRERRRREIDAERYEYHAGRADDLETMRRHHEKLGEVPPESGLYAWWRRFFGRQGRGGAS